jgi:polyhydroxyalkanoate synthesis regulator phasin
MSEQEVRTPMQQVDETIVNVRNEAIVQTANLYIFGRQVMLTSVGIAALAIDAAQAIVERAVERGEIMEADTHKLTTDLQQKASDRAKAANEARVEKTEQATAALLENTNGILKRLGVPEMKVVFADQPGAGTEPKADADEAPSI